MLVTMKEILEKAQEVVYGVPAPNVFYELEARAVLELAEELHAPLILDVMPEFGSSITALARQSKIPVAINLDHGGCYEDIIKAMQCKVTSVMVDRSRLSYEQNVKEVKEIVKIAHAVGISVEAELGHVGRGTHYAVDGYQALTDPHEASRYVEETGVDALAIAIGTAHGMYQGIPKLQFDLLEEIHRLVKTPLVLHGGSGTGLPAIQKACTMGICKVNVNTDLINGAMRELKETMEGKRKGMLFLDIANGYKRVLRNYMEACGCIGKAWTVEPAGVMGEAFPQK